MTAFWTFCAIEGCDRLGLVRGLCPKHHHRAWKIANREHAIQYEKERRARKKAHQRELEAAWREANRDKIRAQHQAWTKRHPDRVRDNTARQRARRKPVLIVGRVSRREVWERDQGICGLCGSPADPERWELDHVIPIHRGGPHSMDNVQVSHPFCNQSKGAA